MKLKIISDGTTQNTQVLDENGNDLAGKIRSMVIHFEPGKPVFADVKFVGVEVDIVVDTETNIFKEIINKVKALFNGAAA